MRADSRYDTVDYPLYTAFLYNLFVFCTRTLVAASSWQITSAALIQDSDKGILCPVPSDVLDIRWRGADSEVVFGSLCSQPVAKLTLTFCVHITLPYFHSFVAQVGTSPTVHKQMQIPPEALLFPQISLGLHTTQTKCWLNRCINCQDCYFWRSFNPGDMETLTYIFTGD